MAPAACCSACSGWRARCGGGGPEGSDWTLPLLPLGALGPDEVYVPAGPFLHGGDPDLDVGGPRWGWREGFAIQRLAVSFADDIAFLDALARDGLPWRLPEELEWEEAARGVDGRACPMGDHLDPSWVWIRESQHASFVIREVDQLSEDPSPYEVMGMASSARCWCSFRFVEPARIRHGLVGIRLACDLRPGEDHA